MIPKEGNNLYVNLYVVFLNFALFFEFWILRMMSNLANFLLQIIETRKKLKKERNGERKDCLRIL